MPQKTKIINVFSLKLPEIYALSAFVSEIFYFVAIKVIR